MIAPRQSQTDLIQRYLITKTAIEAAGGTAVNGGDRSTASSFCMQKRRLARGTQVQRRRLAQLFNPLV
jgi:hypothetical protein